MADYLWQLREKATPRAHQLYLALTDLYARRASEPSKNNPLCFSTMVLTVLTLVTIIDSFALRDDKTETYKCHPFPISVEYVNIVTLILIFTIYFFVLVGSVPC